LNVFVVELRLAGGPVSWGVDFADAPGNPPYEAVLDAIAASGLKWLELGPVGYLPTDVQTARTALKSRGLGAVGTFVFDDFHSARAAERLLSATDAALDAIEATGGTLLLLIDRPGPERAATAGQSDIARRLEQRELTGTIDRLRRSAARATERGVRAVVHPHAGSFIEFEDEIDRLLDCLPADEAGLCLDTGHVLYAGGDVAEAVHRYADRIDHLHLKDVDDEVMARRMSFWKAIAAGAFCAVGEGALDLAALRDALVAIGYTGFATVEQDRRTDTAGDPVDDLERSLARLRAAGLG
jgi:inosose dehydratase